MKKNNIIIFLFILANLVAYIDVSSQVNKNKSTPTVDLSSFKKNYSYLNNANLHQRKINTVGNNDAVMYLVNRLKEMGIKEIVKGYKYNFNIPLGQIISYESSITINNQIIKVPLDGYPLPFSDTQSVKNSIIGLNNSFQNIWIIPAYNNIQDARLPEAQKEDMLYAKAQDAKERGAIGVVFYNNFGEDFVMPFRDNTTKINIGIPVFEISAKIVRDRIVPQRKLSNISLHAKVKPVMGTLSTVIGLIDNNAKDYIVVSTNIDGDTATPYRSTYNTASGMAMILLLAQELISKKSGYNYLLVFHNGTNANTQGSKMLLDDPQFKKYKIAAALHYHDIGVVDQTDMVRVSGIGTYNGWRQYFSNANNNGSGYFLENKGNMTSDFNNYYDHKIPYLAFSSNNYMGNNNLTTDRVSDPTIINILLKSQEILQSIDQVRSMPVFSQTEDYTFVNNTTQISNKNNKLHQKMQNPVSLGVLPDLSYKDGGILIGKVNDGSAADKGGLMVGDVIMQIRNFPVQHYDDYLEAINHFKKGDKIFVKLKRRGNVIQKVITF